MAVDTYWQKENQNVQFFNAINHVIRVIYFEDNELELVTVLFW